MPTDCSSFSSTHTQEHKGVNSGLRTCYELDVEFFLRHLSRNTLLKKKNKEKDNNGTSLNTPVKRGMAKWSVDM